MVRQLATTAGRGYLFTLYCVRPKRDLVAAGRRDHSGSRLPVRVVTYSPVSEITAETLPGALSGPDESRNPFRSARYRWWWAATICGAMGVGIQVVTVPLFVRDRVGEDNRSIVIALALMAQTVPAAILMLFGGVVADRVERRRIITRVYAVAGFVSLAYVFITGFDVQAVWPVFILGAVVGSCDAFGQPARMSMAPQIVSRAQLQNGIILGTVAFMASFQFLGPSIGGILADFFNLTVAFSFEVGFLLLASLIATRISTDRPVPTGKSVIGDLADGLRYVKGQPVLLALLSMQLLPGLLLIGPFRVTTVLIVQDILHQPDRFVGFMSGGFGIGVLAGSMALTGVRLSRRGLVLCASPMLGGLVFVAYGLSTNVWLSLALMVPWGLSAAIFINMVTPLLQENSSMPMLGRVMSMSSLAFAISTPLGFLHSGVVSKFAGPDVSVIASGALFAAIGVLCVLFLRPVRRLR